MFFRNRRQQTSHDYNMSMIVGTAKMKSEPTLTQNNEIQFQIEMLHKCTKSHGKHN